jgi:hypothetical protein
MGCVDTSHGGEPVEDLDERVSEITILTKIVGNALFIIVLLGQNTVVSHTHMIWVAIYKNALVNVLVPGLN